ncbi:MAG: chromosomal replication initiator protein DnaA [Helicobacter sp.]|nr:chromosomal replication initiator protein DnaA [Helicobacter sp.]MDE7254665.1 chromosomal replication initiator protein DnaA [Helicobacter sp.]
MQSKEILEQLKDEISEIEYEHYLKQLQYIEEMSSSSHAVFSAPNILIANWVRTKYMQRIAHLFELRNGNTTTIEIILATQKKSPPKQKNVKRTSILDFTCTFENFVVGGSNRMAHNAASNVAKHQAKFNPLLIYGGTGLGKTHLLNAIGNYVSHNKSVNYVTSEQFLNDFVHHLRNKTMDRFKEKYRSNDYLLIDDIQFFASKGKDMLQEEFFHTFEELHNNRKQIVMTSDKHPKYIDKLDERLKSRFLSGLVCEILQPELETKIRIIKNICQRDRIFLTNDVIEFIATNINNNIREIGGNILQLNVAANIIGQDITLEFARQQLKEHIVEESTNITLERIIDTVALDFNIKPSEISSKSKRKKIVLSRRIVIYLARLLTPNSMPSIAQGLGMKDHSSVSKAYKAIETEIKTNKDFKLKLEELQSKIRLKN